jgi:hypothetical protein
MVKFRYGAGTVGQVINRSFAAAFQVTGQKDVASVTIAKASRHTGTV